MTFKQEVIKENYKVAGTVKQSRDKGLTRAWSRDKGRHVGYHVIFCACLVCVCDLMRYEQLRHFIIFNRHVSVSDNMRWSHARFYNETRSEIGCYYTNIG